MTTALLRWVAAAQSAELHNQRRKEDRNWRLTPPFDLQHRSAEQTNLLNEDSGARSDQTLIKSAERRRRVFYDSGAAVWFLTPNQLNSSAAPDVKAPVGLLVNQKKKRRRAKSSWGNSLPWWYGGECQRRNSRTLLWSINYLPLIPDAADTEPREELLFHLSWSKIKPRGGSDKMVDAINANKKVFKPRWTALILHWSIWKIIYPWGLWSSWTSQKWRNDSTRVKKTSGSPRDPMNYQRPRLVHTDWERPTASGWRSDKQKYRKD